MSRKRDQQLLRKMGTRIQTLRKSRGWTQEALAERLGVQPVTLSRYETGHRTPDISTLVQLATLLGVAVGALVEDEAAPKHSGHPPDISEAVAILGRLDKNKRLLALRLLRVVEL